MDVSKCFYFTTERCTAYCVAQLKKKQENLGGKCNKQEELAFIKTIKVMGNGQFYINFDEYMNEIQKAWEGLK